MTRSSSTRRTSRDSPAPRRARTRWWRWRSSVAAWRRPCGGRGEAFRGSVTTTLEAGCWSRRLGTPTGFRPTKMPLRPDDARPEETPDQATDSLAKYRAKRSADKSPEPVGTVSVIPGRLFVVHKHDARQLHFDLRMEMDGVLKSWAVPKGPSYDMADKRLAVRVEDHPMEYGDFEGIIPKGNYGAGGIIVWDRGEWVPLEDWREGLEKGKLLFELRGYKLHGKWTLVKIKKSERDWLLIKERDGWVRQPGDVFPEESVLSGLTVEEVKAGVVPNTGLREALEQNGAQRARVDPRKVEAMHAEPRDEAFTRDGWIFELKLDGYRLIA